MSLEWYQFKGIKYRELVFIVEFEFAGEWFSMTKSLLG